jgi:hypothetical protein
VGAAYSYALLRLQELLGVVAIADNDVWAVGYFHDVELTNQPEQTYILHWDGSEWDAVSSPNVNEENNRLTAVAAVDEDEVWAVGYYVDNGTTKTLTMRWDGDSWDIISSPSPAYTGSTADFLTGVAASSDGDVKAIGYFYNGNNNLYQTLALHWNGTNWVAPSIPNTGSSHNYLRAITIADGYDDARAVGYYLDSGQKKPQILKWNGTNWSSQSVPSYSYDVELNSVDSLSTSSLRAVGSIDKSPWSTLILRWNSSTSSWTSETSPNQGSSNNYLLGVAMVPVLNPDGSRDLWAVGHYNNSGTQNTLTMRYVVPSNSFWDP